MITVVLLLMILAVVVAVVTLKLRPRGGAWCVREKAGRHGGEAEGPWVRALAHLAR